jgi:hypothetical protein
MENRPGDDNVVRPPVLGIPLSKFEEVKIAFE